MVRIGSNLNLEARAQIVKFLCNHSNVLAWLIADMPGIDPKVILHSLNVDTAHQPIKQKKRHFTPDRVQAVNQEVDKLL